MDKIKTLLSKYYEGDTTQEEENELRLFFSKSEIPESMRIDGELFMMMAETARESVPHQQPLPAYIEEKPAHTLRLNWFAAAAAAVTLLVAGLAMGLLFTANRHDQVVLNDIQQDLAEMKQLVVLAKLNDQSPSERILATYQVKAMADADEEVIEALVYTLQNDNNVNVKMAAADALVQFENRDKVRSALIVSLSNADEPLLRIKLIDMLVRMQEKRALPQLKKVMENEAEMPVVRQKAAQGISQLI
jgi:hypothetical protein